jgi:hypothetical protein
LLHAHQVIADWLVYINLHLIVLTTGVGCGALVFEDRAPPSGSRQLNKQGAEYKFYYSLKFLVAD